MQMGMLDADVCDAFPVSQPGWSLCCETGRFVNQFHNHIFRNIAKVNAKIRQIFLAQRPQRHILIMLDSMELYNIMRMLKVCKQTLSMQSGCCEIYR